MQFWYNRYTVPGWFFVGSLILLSRSLPFPVLQGVILQKQWTSALALIGLFAGAPLGYLIYAAVEFWYRRVFGGTGQFVDHKRLRSGMLEACNRILNNGEMAELKGTFFRIKAILENRKAFPDRAVYSIMWQSHAAKDFRDMCHKRWESFHVAWGIICGLLLAVAISFTYSWSIGLYQDYLRQNTVVLSIILAMLLLLYHNARLVAKQAASQENLWIELFLTRIENYPEAFFELLQL